MPFPPPHFLKAQLKSGFVDVSSSARNDDGGSSGDVRGWDSSGAEHKSTEAMPQTSLERNETMPKRIIEIQMEPLSRKRELNDEKNSRHIVAFWLQRKLGHQSSSRDLVVRLGYRLRPTTKAQKGINTTKTNTNGHVNSSEHPPQHCEWELDTDGSGRLMLVRVHIQNNNIVDMKQLKGRSMNLNSPFNELSALQMIAKQNHSSSSQMVSQSAHVVGTNLIATDDENRNIYAILPYHRDGTLLQFCQSLGRLEEPLARFIFRQIVQGLNTLRSSGLCHRNISLDTIAMDGDHIDIIGLDWALRYDGSKEKKKIQQEDIPYVNPRFIAPESFHYRSSSKESEHTSDDSERVWDGFRDDLWATGLVLYSMVVGTDALFTAPIAGDKIFTRLCIRGDIRGEAKRFGERLGKDYSNLLSDDLVDLLQSMLNGDPNKRSLLEEVMKHPWVTNDDDPVMTPTQYAGSHQINL